MGAMEEEQEALVLHSNTEFPEVLHQKLLGVHMELLIKWLFNFHCAVISCVLLPNNLKCKWGCYLKDDLAKPISL